MEKLHDFAEFVASANIGKSWRTDDSFPGMSVDVPSHTHVDVVETSCVYPSMALVAVEVYVLRNGQVRVTDGGAGIAEVNAFASGTGRPGSFLAHYARIYGADYRNGKVFLDVEDTSRIAEAIARVANASKDGALRAVEEHASVFKLNFKSVFSSFVRERFGDKFKKRLARGESGKIYTFDYVHQEGDEPELSYDRFFALADPVSPEPQAIASRVQIHRDLLSLLGHSAPWLHIVYDDDNDPWTRENLTLLQQGGVPFMPFSEAEKVLPMIVTPSRSSFLS